jgi:hypothetical protein
MAFLTKRRVGSDYVFVEFTGTKGDTRAFDIPRDVSRSDLHAVTLYLDGLLTSTRADDPSYTGERRAICLSSDLPDLKAGQYTLTVSSDIARHTCVFAKTQARITAELVQLSAGQSYTLTKGRTLYVALGTIEQIEAPGVHVAETKDVELTALTDAVGVALALA